MLSGWCANSSSSTLSLRGNSRSEGKIPLVEERLPRPTTGGAQEGAERPWRRRVFGG
jgi:hypothetical protein